jgi:hypothetical protein
MHLYRSKKSCKNFWGNVISKTEINLRQNAVYKLQIGDPHETSLIP